MLTLETELKRIPFELCDRENIDLLSTIGLNDTSAAQSALAKSIGFEFMLTRARGQSGARGRLPEPSVGLPWAPGGLPEAPGT